MDAMKKKIAELIQELADLAAADRTIESATRILAAREELKSVQSDVATHEAAEAALAEVEAERVAAAAVPDETVDVPADDAPADDNVVVEDAPEVDAPVALAASAASASLTAHEEDKPRITLTASGAVAGISTGQGLDRGSMQEMLNISLRAAGSNQIANGSLFRVNTHEHGTAAVKSNASAMENTRAMNAAHDEKQRPFALTAAACFCGPDDVVRALNTIGDANRPVAALFGSSPMESTGSFRYVRNLTLSDVQDNGGVNIWTCDDQALVDANDPETWKTCASLNCFDEVTVVPYFVKGCATIENPHKFAHPEQVDAFINLLYVDYARKAERALLDVIEADAGAPLTVGAGTMAAHGLLSQFIYALGSVEHPLAYEHRTTGLEGMTAIISVGMLKALLADEHLRGFNHNKSMSELRAKLEGDYGLSLSVRRDESTSLTAASLATVAALNGGGPLDSAPPTTNPNPWRTYLLNTSMWRRGEGSVVGADYHTDSNLLRQNRTMYFWENMEFLERTGQQKSYAIDIVGCINGARSDLVTPPACTD